ncbi:hypothetical protein [Bartonella schoenbuchensis]|uniref:hypothetical protein n=1 Tax=Bartonella schoenbuchensis TaxID=165694 RepID=UPI0003A9525F|nr:hypothetical protein [Bartonella schoenbuchensis]
MGVFIRGRVWEGPLRGGFLKEHMMGVEAGVNGERGMWIVLVRGRWRLGVRALCIGGGR